MASVVDKFVFALMLDAKGFKQGAETAMSALGSIKNAFLKTYSLIGGFDLFKNMLYTYTDVSKSIDDFSLITGENIYQLQAWQKAIQDTGGDIAGLQGTIRKFTDMQAQLKRYGTASGIEEFLRVGIDPRGKSAFQILQQVGKLLSTVKDNARAFNIARNLGIDESTFIMLRRYGENFDKIIKANEKYAYINQQAIRDTREYNRIVSNFKTSWLHLSSGIMKQVLPVLQNDLFPVLERGLKYIEEHNSIENLADGLGSLAKILKPIAEDMGKVAEGWAFLIEGVSGVKGALDEKIGQVKDVMSGSPTSLISLGKLAFSSGALNNLSQPVNNNTWNISKLEVKANNPEELSRKLDEKTLYYSSMGGEQLGSMEI